MDFFLDSLPSPSTTNQMTTWAERAQQAPTATPSPPSSSRNPVQKSSSSDNWRVAAAVTNSPGTSSVSTKSSAKTPTGQNLTGKDKEKKSASTENAVDSSTSWSAEVDDSLPSLPSPFFESTTNISKLSTEESNSVPSNPTEVTPSTPASSILDSISSETASETAPSEVASTAASTSAEIWTTVLPKTKSSAPTPKVNVWSVRKEQMAAAGNGSNAASSSSGNGGGKSSGKESNRHGKSSDANHKSQPSKSKNTQTPKEVKEPKESPSAIPVTTTPKPVLPPATETITKKVPEGWNAPVAATIASSAVQDKESWPSPIEEIKKGKDKAKKGIEKVEEVDESLPKKKGERSV